MNLFKNLKRTPTLLWTVLFGVAVVFGIITVIDAVRQDNSDRLFKRIVFLVIYIVFFISNLIKYLKEVKKGTKDNEGEVSY